MLVIELAIEPELLARDIFRGKRSPQTQSSCPRWQSAGAVLEAWANAQVPSFTILS